MAQRPERTRTLILSFAGAIVIWLMNELNKDGYTMKVSYPIRVSYNDSLYVPLTAPPRMVQAILNGNGWALLRKSVAFTVSPIIYEIANPTRTRTLNTNTLAALMSEQVKDVRVNGVLADTTILDFDRRLSKTVVLRPDSSHLDLENRFVVSSLINLTPNVVRFDGPAFLINQISDTILIKIPNQRIRANYDEELPIPYPHSSLVKSSAERVFVSFEVAELLRKQP